MNNISGKLYLFCLQSIRIIALLLTGTLFLSGLLLTCFSTDMESQKVLTTWDNPLFTYLPTGLMCLIFCAAADRISKGGLLSRRRLRLCVLGWCVITGIVQILFSKSVPAADAYSVYSIAESLAAGDTSVIDPVKSYLSYYPQQVGLVGFEEILIRIWNLTGIDEHAYHFIKIIYILLECIIILFQEKIVHTLWKDERTDCLYLLLAGTNCPLLMYTAFVYGEIPSFAAISIAFYFLARLLTPDSASKLSGLPRIFVFSLGSLLFLTLSVMLRKNSLIFVIGVIIVLILWGIRRRKPYLPVLAILCAVCAMSILPCIQKYYESRSGSTLRSGVPAMSYFAMGMQEGPRACGWYNGFNFNTYRDTGMDTAATVDLSREAIHRRLDDFREAPGYAVHFYLQKYLSQWADGTFPCRQATLNTFGGRAPIFDTLYEGVNSKYLIAYCNLYQNMLYLGAFSFCLAPYFKKRFPASKTTNQKRSSSLADAPESAEATGLNGITDGTGGTCLPNTAALDETNASPPVPAANQFELPAYLGLIVILGGFLFHMIWEGNSRYIFLYGLTMLPYTARGMVLLQNAASKVISHSRTTPEEHG